ncbi:hypothetical protein F5Y19DRAFT_118501 [Xylariaceae sp. FL1651]|nr:hypothetical protein F5Y19DRAFT_118501 [Xylariaceae sp. FL1651]
MADAQEETQPALQPSRIKRNTACTSCRDAKVRCNPSSNPNQPCQRCVKLHLSCVVDKTHKRISRRSKLDELVQEIQSIKQSVESTSSTNLPRQNAVAPPRELATQQLRIPSPSGLSSGSTSKQHAPVSMGTGILEPAVALNTPATSLLADSSVEPSLPRTLGSYPFSGEDIDYYFQKYFECYHPYMPVVRHRDPNKCYESCPLLFWTIIYVGSRRYAKTTSLVPFLAEEIRRQVFSVLSDIPLSLTTINAIILICSWIFPGVRFINDPASVLTNVIGNAALLLGIHTGRGGHPEYSHGVFQNNFTDEEATYTWAGLNIVTQRVSSYLGVPPLSTLFNQTIQNTIDGRMPFHVPSNFRVLLECQKFCNRVNKIVVANLEESKGVSTHIVQVLEDEWNTVQGIICSERADDLDRFNALLVQLEIQVFYLIPPPGHNPDSLKQHVLRTFHTASSVIRDALELDQKIGFLAHITHLHMRYLVTASCVIFKLLRSSYMQFLDHKPIEDTAASDAVTICQRATVVEGDLPMRLGTMLGTFLELCRSTSRTSWHQEQPITSSYPHRLGASVAFDCFIRWKTDGALRTVFHQKQQQLQQQQQHMSNPLGGAIGEDTDTLLPSSVPDLMAMDWTFMDDFEWNLGPPTLWHGMAR